MSCHFVVELKVTKSNRLHGDITRMLFWPPPLSLSRLKLSDPGGETEPTEPRLLWDQETPLYSLFVVSWTSLESQDSLDSLLFIAVVFLAVVSHDTSVLSADTAKRKAYVVPYPRGCFWHVSCILSQLGGAFLFPSRSSFLFQETVFLLVPGCGLFNAESLVGKIWGYYSHWLYRNSCSVECWDVATLASLALAAGSSLLTGL